MTINNTCLVIVFTFRRKILKGFIKYPRFTNSSPTNHDRLTSRCDLHLARI
ncbi:uncharacterized protein METZ01_LOCUS192366 [marine metagenome]|uniref:Uncharacterized protein n=1 Tax=marine metagenome TaxID=408172 RepID=A0A382DNA1_9ZZZZ